MSFAAGSRLGSYEITAQIGAGGMGEVYRARDTKLNRDVALKVLPDSFSNDPDRLARFQREAQILASLNHPNIAHIHGLEDSGGVRALVMELVEGEDLAQRLTRGAIPLDEALPIAKQVAEALEAAHEQGIIHRDLKPANVKVTLDGRVKVLDFGLAKAMDPPASSPNVSLSPTITSPAMTQAGMILGTAAYMSPEQAKGRPADKRSDIWGFGCVLFEMLTGRRAFPGDDLSETLAAVIKSEPEWSKLPANAPAAIRRLLRRCLAKDRLKRIGDASAARLEIDDALHEPDASDQHGRPSRRAIAWLAIAAAVAIAALGAMAIPAARYLRGAVQPEMRVDIETPWSTDPLEFALSPDGRSLVFVASGDGAKRLWLRRFNQSDAHPIEGTDGADSPFWSPDGKSIGFFAATRLYRINLAGAAPQMLAEAIQAFGGSWGTDGTILFAANTNTGIMRVPENGGPPVAVTRLAAGGSGHRYPQSLPDHQHFLFYVRAVPNQNGLYLGSLDGGEPKRLTATDAAGAFLPPDRVVFERDGALVARRLDLKRGELTGDATVLADSVAKDTNAALPGFSVSATGDMAYRGGQAGRLQLTWVDRDGKVVGRASDPDPNGYRYPELSPDGGRVALTRVVKGNSDVWIMDLSRGGFRNFTFDLATDTLPVWSGDGKRIAFTSNRKGPYNIYVGQADRPGAEQVFLESPNNKVVCDWSHDDRFLLYYEVNPTTSRDLWVLDLSSKERHVIANTPFEETQAQFSPNGRWIAYQTNATGRFEVVVKAFPDPGREWPVSTGGGIESRWSKDGKELFFLAPDASLMAAAVTATATTFEAKPPVKLFSTRIVSGGSGGGVASNHPDYVVSPDGRFLINQVADEFPAPIKLILNVGK